MNARRFPLKGRHWLRRSASTPFGHAEQNSDVIARGDAVQLHFLALSGGGGDGAYGAGLLTGWTETGTRPEFQVVTGVSTGALIAPFAFLGSDYDDILRRAYTETGQGDIFSRAVLPNLVSGAALTDTSPLYALVERFIDQPLLDAIAIEHRRGRRLLVATTNIDAGRPVIWDMGAIASSGNENALDLFRRVTIASASIPGLFPPVPFTVEAGGEAFTEIHVDGGITSQIFAYQPQVRLGDMIEASAFDVEINLHVIRNGRFQMQYHETRVVWYDLMVRSLDVLLSHQAISDIYRIYYLSQRDGLSFNLAYIPESFEPTPASQFDHEYMVQLFEFAQSQMRAGTVWNSSPF